jgi:DNA-binding transcriptional regulator GbsR (MarR family)
MTRETRASAATARSLDRLTQSAHRASGEDESDHMAKSQDQTNDEQDPTRSEDTAVSRREEQRRQFAEDFSLTWEQAGSPRMDGRILGYLMVMEEPFISSADLAAVLQASAGSVSMSTRRMVDAGFIRRHVVPGDRSHYFRADPDPWGSFLAGERRYLNMERDVIEAALAETAEHELAARARLTNARDYMVWLAAYHHKMLDDWEAYKAGRATPPAEESS